MKFSAIFLRLVPWPSVDIHGKFYGDRRKLIIRLPINYNLPPTLHRFGNIALDMSKIAIFATSLAFNTPDGGGSPGTISVQFSVNVKSTDGHVAENFNPLSRAHERYRQQTSDDSTDGRAIAYSEREREFRLKQNNHMPESAWSRTEFQAFHAAGHFS